MHSGHIRTHPDLSYAESKLMLSHTYEICMHPTDHLDVDMQAKTEDQLLEAITEANENTDK